MDGQNRMSEGPIGGAIIRFAVPLFFGNLFQQLYTTVDSLIVGNMLGNDALAAVSATSTLINLLIGFFNGVFIGAGVVVARFFGASLLDSMKRAIHTTVAIALVSGLLMTAFGTLFTPVILRWMGTPEAIFTLTTSYIRTYFLGALGLILYNACVGIMQAVGDSRHPLYYLVVSSVVNVILDLVFIGVFKWDVWSAALATIISQFLSVILCLTRLMTTNDTYRVSLRELRFDPDMVRMIISFGLPSGLQNSIINFANIIVQSNINSFGTMAISGCGAYSKVEGFAFLPITSFTAAITTFVSQNLGAKEYERAKKGSRFGIFCSISIAELIGVLMFVFAMPLIAAFTNEQEAIAFGVQKCRICALFYCLLASSHCFAAVLRGAGKSKVPMFVMLSCWCIFRVTFITVLTPIFKSIAVVNWVYPVTWSLSTIILAIYYLKADWLHGLEVAA